MRAQITLGLRQGYSGPRIAPDDVIDFLMAEVTGEVSEGRCWLPWQVTDSRLVYVHENKVFNEPSLVLSTDRNVHRNGLSEGEWKVLVEGVAMRLKGRFAQDAVFVTYIPHASIVIV